MTKRTRWRGLASLVRDAVDATTDLVGVGHASAHRGIQRAANASGVGGPTRPVREVVHLGTRGTLATVKGVNRLVGLLAETVVDATVSVRPDTAPVPLRSDVVGASAWVADASLAALNATVGDHLAATDNPLDLGLQLRVGDTYLTEEALTTAALVVVHGLGTTEWCWSLDAEQTFGDPAASIATLLAADLASEPVYARYNTGRRIATNGRELAEALERHLADSPSIVVVGHSMGGLVARAACRHAEEAGHRWIHAVTWVVSLGTPHQGAPLARLGATLTGGLEALDLPTTQVLAGILRGRSGGVRDLEQGDITGAPHATPTDPVVVGLVEGPRYAFLGTTVVPDPENSFGRWMGDLLVQTASSAGPVNVSGPTVQQALLGGIPHYKIQADARVLDVLRDLLTQSPSA